MDTRGARPPGEEPEKKRDPTGMGPMKRTLSSKIALASLVIYFVAIIVMVSYMVIRKLFTGQ